MSCRSSISDEVLELLREGSIEENVFFLHASRQLKGDSPLPRDLYVSFNKVMDALGGKWNRGKGGHVFAGSPGDAIADVLEDGFLVDAKKELQQFYTPPEVAQMAVAALGTLKVDAQVLEPSAGQGALIEALLSDQPDVYVDAFEIDEENACILKELDYPDHVRAWHQDFLTAQVTCRYDAVLMNPPFANGQDVDHVTRALEKLKPGGRLVAIMSPGFQFRSTSKFVAFREMVEGITTSCEDLPEGAFKGSGTYVRTVLLCLDMPEAVCMSGRTEEEVAAHA